MISYTIALAHVIILTIFGTKILSALLSSLPTNRLRVSRNERFQSITCESYIYLPPSSRLILGEWLVRFKETRRLDFHGATIFAFS